MLELWLNPWRASLALTAAMLDNYLAMQKGLMNLSTITLSDGFDRADENAMREAFQRAADTNVRRWSDAAETLQKLPTWYHTAQRLPGNTLTDYFDTAQRKRG